MRPGLSAPSAALLPLPGRERLGAVGLLCQRNTHPSRPHSPHLSPLSRGTQAIRSGFLALVPWEGARRPGKGAEGGQDPVSPSEVSTQFARPLRCTQALPAPPGVLCPLFHPISRCRAHPSSAAPDLGRGDGSSELRDAGTERVHSGARSPPPAPRALVLWEPPPAEPPWGEEPCAMLALPSS